MTMRLRSLAEPLVDAVDVEAVAAEEDHLPQHYYYYYYYYY